MIASLKKAFRETDKILLLLCFTLSAIGIVAVSSATHASVTDGGFFSRDAKVMLIAVALGALFALFISFFDYDLILKLWPIVGIACLGLMLILFTPLGCAPNGRTDSRCWIKITSTLYFQPSEIVKIGFVITFAAHCEKVREENISFKNIIFL
ncbi:MAG: FtsW/RodA/SpoVE family cell cycle protein, partial [Acutalibacteraceae bacterium]